METARLFLCARCRCQVRVCSRCDRGQQYCGPHCSAAARTASRRRAGARYQDSRRGRFHHAERQRRYRARRRAAGGEEKVTHHGFAVALEPDSLCAVPASRARPSGPLPPPVPSAARCHFCGRAVSAFVRQGWLRRGREERRR